MRANKYKIQAGKHTAKQARFLTSKEVNNLLAACDTATNRVKRDLALLKSFLYLELRVGELVSLSTDDFGREPESQRILALMGTYRSQIILLPE